MKVMTIQTIRIFYEDRVVWSILSILQRKGNNNSNKATTPNNSSIITNPIMTTIPPLTTLTKVDLNSRICFCSVLCCLFFTMCTSNVPTYNPIQAVGVLAPVRDMEDTEVLGDLVVAEDPELDRTMVAVTVATHLPQLMGLVGPPGDLDFGRGWRRVDFLEICGTDHERRTIPHQVTGLLSQDQPFHLVLRSPRDHHPRLGQEQHQDSVVQGGGKPFV